ncbi:GNAT family N-acetyltransferase [Methanoculleus sp.]|jgi:hypoxanthine phosphoribosyltransferase/GNAT superfamily N-acetyltransferase|uniref:GNAT family N-acetyltransferase n=1 Tax=Methanoculleus sp. TaxID=90427 RepID=UPI002BD2B6C0|nr:GNAT family N-acetyltransferase [Methanoculleus sp.]HNT09071.1 GNAT family N-acetyltransferase [Methanoculleus sp.]
MPIFVCDEVLNRMIASLSDSVKAAYSLPGETIRYPIFIGAGDSGNAIGSRIAAMLRQTEGAEIAFYPLDVGQKGEELSEVNPEHFKGSSVLVCDSIVNTGKTLSRLKHRFQKLGAGEVRTLTVFLRRDATFVPNFWVSDISKDEVVFFGTDRYPINTYYRGNIRKLGLSHCGKEVNCGKPFIHSAIDDYYFRQCVDPTYCGYVLEDGDSIVGLLFFKHIARYQIYLEALGVRSEVQRSGYGSTLAKFFDDYCGMNGITRVKLHAHESAVEFWDDIEFTRTGLEFTSPMYGKFYEMERELRPFSKT